MIATCHNSELDYSPNCPVYIGTPGDAVHVMLYCPSFAIERGNLNQALGINMSPESIVTEMLKSKEN